MSDIQFMRLVGVINVLTVLAAVPFIFSMCTYILTKLDYGELETYLNQTIIWVCLGIFSLRAAIWVIYGIPF